MLFYLLALNSHPCVWGIGCANPIKNNGSRGLNSPPTMLKMCPQKNAACVIDLGYLFELAKWISWIFVASFESTPILNQTHRLLKDLIWHLTILYINIPHFFLDQHNPSKSQHQQSLHQKNKMLLLSLCSSTEFCRSLVNLDRFIFCHFLNCEQDLAGSALWKHSHKQSHFITLKEIDSVASAKVVIFCDTERWFFALSPG